MKSQVEKTVYVAMSGGVDSSVAAALLKKKGFDVTGVFFKPWSPQTNGLVFCDWKEERLSALKVAVKLKIPFLTWDFSEEYGKKVAKYMIDSYRNGITPNPDVKCNEKIKFGLFLDKALKSGADFIATGHYVRLRRDGKSCQLLKAKDKNKDQSYFLWTLTKKQLKHCIFPIGNYTKKEVRKMAKELSLPNWNKKDSQGICFVGDLNLKEFLKEYIKPVRGKIVNEKNEIIGEHDGVHYYTLGQRRGFKIISKSGPYYVIKKDLKNNILVVGKNKKYNKKTALKNIIFTGNNKNYSRDLQVRIRHGGKLEHAKLIRKNIKNKTGELIFKNPQESVTTGQSAVLYAGEKMIGGGIMDN